MRREEKAVSHVKKLSKKLDEILQRPDLLEKLIVKNSEYKGMLPCWE